METPQVISKFYGDTPISAVFTLWLSLTMVKKFQGWYDAHTLTGQNEHFSNFFLFTFFSSNIMITIGFSLLVSTIVLMMQWINGLSLRKNLKYSKVEYPVPALRTFLYPLLALFFCYYTYFDKIILSIAVGVIIFLFLIWVFLLNSKKAYFKKEQL